MKTFGFIALLSLLFSGTKLEESGLNQVSTCRIFGSIYIETNKAMAQYTVGVSETEGLADLIVYKTPTAGYADATGLWYITTEKAFADHIIYIEKGENAPDFVVCFTEFEEYARCK